MTRGCGNGPICPAIGPACRWRTCRTASARALWPCPEEDLARELLTNLSPDQSRTAVFSATPPDDILTRADPIADPDLLPEGLGYGDLTSHQQGLLRRLVRRYLDRAPAEYADQCWAEAVDAGLDRLGFAWAGGAKRGARHYYCVTAPHFLIEYDNTQNGGNHAHSVWRHLRHDFGTDILRLHYATRHTATTAEISPGRLTG